MWVNALQNQSLNGASELENSVSHCLAPLKLEIVEVDMLLLLVKDLMV